MKVWLILYVFMFDANGKIIDEQHTVTKMTTQVACEDTLLAAYKAWGKEDALDHHGFIGKCSDGPPKGVEI